MDSNNPETAAWIRITLTSYPRHLEHVSDLLEKFDAISVSFTPATGEPIFGDESEKNRYWEQTSVSALFNPDVDPDILIACIRNQVGTENILDFRMEPVGDTNWLEKYRAGFAPMVFGERLCICPSWLTPPPLEHVIELDPGLAFGTGTHPTTSLCLQWLATHEVRGKRVIDYGCGSGILALAAAKLGAATPVTGIDIDPQALIATIENARRNGLEDRIITALPADLPMQQADILLANILLNPLLRLAESFSRYLPAGGSLVLSGILATQADECRQTYRQWFDMDEPVFREEWAMLTGTRHRTG